MNYDFISIVGRKYFFYFSFIEKFFYHIKRAGSGLLLGYDPTSGPLERPTGFGGANYGYSYVHPDGSYDMSRPYSCAEANFIKFLRKDEFVEVEVREAEVKCSSEKQVCYGTMTISEVSFKMEDFEEPFVGYKVGIF